MNAVPEELRGGEIIFVTPGEYHHRVPVADQIRHQPTTEEAPASGNDHMPLHPVTSHMWDLPVKPRAVNSEVIKQRVSYGVFEHRGTRAGEFHREM